jgi:U3 small nucleolar RNA-associated protein 14
MPVGKDGKNKIRKGAGLLPQQRRALEDDAYEEDYDGGQHEDYRQKRLDKDAGFDDGLPNDFEDEDICSDDEDDVEDLLPASMRKKKASGGAAGKKVAAGKGRRGRHSSEEEDEEDEDEDEDELGSSADSEEYTDLSKMLDDDDGEDTGSAPAPSADRGASERMLQAAGLGGKKRLRERTEGREEAEYAAGAGAGLSVDALVGSLAGAEGFGQLRRDLASLSRVAGSQRATRAQLDAPLERVDKQRVERQAATGAAHADVSLWQGAVQKHREAEHLKFPLDRPAKAANNGSTAALTSSFKATSAMEKGVEALLEAHGLTEGAIAKGEELELSNIDADEVAKRTAELRKMRDLLFHHERKLKRASKIKSKSYRRVHKKARAARQEADAQLAVLDKQTAQRLALRKEVDRVRERMTLKHKNTSRWAKNALKQQKSNPALRLAVAEQLQKGEELRRKQEDADAAGRGGGSSDDSISDSEEDDDLDDEDGGEEGEEGGSDLEDGVADLARSRPSKGARGKRDGPGSRTASGLLSALQQEEDPALPTKGVLGMGFMQRAVERQRAEAAAVLKQLEEEAREAEAEARRGEGSSDDDSDDDGDGDGGSGGGKNAGAGRGKGRAGRGAEGSDDDDDDDDDDDEDEDEEDGAGGERGEIRRTERLIKKAANAAKSAQEAKRDAMRIASGGGRRHVGGGGGGGGAAAAASPAAAGERSSKRSKKAAAASEGAAGAARGVLQACSSAGPITVAGGEQLPQGGAKGDGDGAAASGKKGKKRKGAAATEGEDAWGVSEWLGGAEGGASDRANVPRNFGGGGAKAAPQPPLADRAAQPPLVTSDTQVSKKSRKAGNKADSASAAAAAAAQASAGAASAASAGASKKLAGAMKASAAASAAAEASAADATDGLVHGASLLAPSTQQQRLIDEAFPESAAADFAAEKARLAEVEAPKDDGGAAELPGWGSWSGLGAKPDRRAEERKQTAAEARAALIAEAAARRKDAALRNVIISEKRDKKAAQFTTAGVPFPFSSREQFERSLRAPLGKEWNTAASHKALTAPSMTVVQGAVIAPIAMHNKAVAGATGGGKSKGKGR